MTPIAVAELLERFADQVIQLPGVSRTNPHAFAEAKSELRGDMIAEAKRLRTMATPAPVRGFVGAIAPGVRTFGRREVPVVSRARRSAS